MRVNGVFEGGGISGIAFVGAIEAMEERGYKWDRLAGTSAGSLIASLLASGYSSKELKDIMIELDYRKFLQEGWLNKLPLVGKWFELWFHLGLYRNDYLERWMKALLAKKGVRTFGDLPAGKLKIIASDISNGRMLVIPDDLSKYGVSERDFSVARAVRMSTSIPFYFRPVKWRTSKQKEPAYIVDGGILSNYPIWIFDHAAGPPPTFGFRLSGRGILGQPAPIKGPVSMFKAVIRTMLQNQDLRHVEDQHAVRTVFIPTGNITPTHFDLNAKERDFLYSSGYQATVKFFDKWNSGKK